MNDNDRNRLTLFRRFDRTDRQPVAKGDGLVGENDYRLSGSMWPSRKGQRKDGTPWQMWSVSLGPAQGETRKLVAVPPHLVERVLDMIASDGGEGGASGLPAPEPPDEVAPEQDDLPF